MIYQLLLIVILLTPSSYSSIGEKLEVESLPSGLCKITISKNLTNEIYHCTGSYLGSGFIKTAGHCLQNAEIKHITCSGTKETFYPLESMVFPSYNHDLINREEFNRWQDHALIQLDREPQIPALKIVSKKEELLKLLPDFSECLMSGYGINERNPTKTGILHGSGFSAKKIRLKNQLIYVEGIYQVKLMPGDSGGPLLCRRGESWYDLGTASAHNWDHDSLYAPNFAVKNWHDQFPLNQTRLNFYPPLENGNHTKIDLEVGKSYFLLPYSEVLTKEGTLYNGDNTFIKVTVESIEEERVYATIETLGSSSFYLCVENFLCYGNSVKGHILKKRLVQKRYRH